jgi:hypothetical protein
VHLDVGYRLDVLVDNLVVLELKAVEALLLTYLKLGGWGY